MERDFLLSQVLPRVNKPGRYLGCEAHSVYKNADNVSLRFALAFPDVYEVAFSHIGLMILYEILNRRADIWAERVYAPWPDFEAELRSHNLALYGLESKDPLKFFDIVGFSHQHELDITNILTMLDLGGIPICSKDRNETHPLVLLGGPCASNPEPLADFVDAVLLGDGEKAILELADAVIHAKQNRLNRPETLDLLEKIEGVYVPSRWQEEMDSHGRSLGRVHVAKGRVRIKKAIASNFDSLPFIERPLVPTVEPVHDRYAVEIQRGCTRGCRFCQAGMIYRPVRQRAPETVARLARNGLAMSGQDTLGLLSLSAGDYRCLEPLLTSLYEEHAGERVSITLPSLRVDALSDHLVGQLSRERKTGFTLAPEAATERLRKVINKGNTEEDLLRSLEHAFRRGWRNIKLYFMIGLPTETDDDVLAIVDLARKIRTLARSIDKAIHFTVSVSTFVPKPHTPFQWAGMISEEETRRKQRLLKNGLSPLGIAFKWHDAGATTLESALARGGRELCQVIEKTWRKGARFDAWSDTLRLDLWRESFLESGKSMEETAARTLGLDAALPWGHLDYGLEPEFLREEYHRALNGENRLDCSYGACEVCGVCDHEVVAREVFVPETNQEIPHAQSATVGKFRASKASLGSSRVVRFQYEKCDYSVFLGHLDVMAQMIRAFRRAGILLRYSDGFHPKPKLSFSQALPLGVVSRVEYFDAELFDPAPPSLLMERLNRALPMGIKTLSARPISGLTMALAESIASVTYEFDFSFVLSPEQVEGALQRFSDLTEFPIKRVKEKRERILDLKRYLLSFERKTPTKVAFAVLSSMEGSVKPSEIMAEVFNVPLSEHARIAIEKIEVRFAPSRNSGKFKNEGDSAAMKVGLPEEKNNGSAAYHQRGAPGNQGGADGKRSDGRTVHRKES